MMNSATANPIAPHEPVVTWRWAPVWVLLYVIFWPAPGIAEGILVLGALFAITKLLLARFKGGTALLSTQAWALTSVLFFAYWTPQLISSFDAINQTQALKKTLTALRYLPFLWLVAAAVADAKGRRTTFYGLGIIFLVWTIDALIQAVIGTSPIFWSLDSAKFALENKHICSLEEVAAVDRLSGVLGACNLKLGVVLASMSPFVLYLLSKKFGLAGWIVGAALVGIVILLAGSRASWITYALVLLISGWRLLGWKKLLGVFAAGLVALLVLSQVSPQVEQRLERTAHAIQADEAGVDSALSGRSRIWSAAVCMIKTHPINGVGARNFRNAFPSCDPEPGKPAAWGEGPAFHAHQIILEVLSETGVIGLLLWLAGAAMVWRAWKFADKSARDQSQPALLALVVTVFPFNTHLAFYSTFWGGVTLMLAALYIGSLLGKQGADTK